MKLLIINPNSTQDITDGIAESLDPHCPANAELTYFTAPAHAPTAIRDYVTGIQTAAACFDGLVKIQAFEKFDGFLVCCCESFSPTLPFRNLDLILLIFHY
jgi:Asp/Glu/hydantoin racemase